MTNQQHPITPNPEQIYLWQNDWKLSSYEPGITETIYLATQAARWGADQELEACCGWLAQEFPREQTVIRELRAARRPKPPSLKEQALKMLDDVERFTEGNFYIIRRALEQLDD